MYVELSLIETREVDEEWAIHSDFVYHLRQQVKGYTCKIPLRRIIVRNDGMVILRGTSGQGKTCLVDQLAYIWGKGKRSRFRCNGYRISKRFSLVFVIPARDLNMHEKDESIESICDLIRLFYDVDLDDDEIDWRKVLIIVDGIDELSCLNNVVETKRKHTKFEAIIDKILSLRKGNTVLLTGRPEACLKAQMHYQKDFEVKRIETTGFSEASVHTYVKKFFKGQPENAARLLQHIHDIPNLNAMSKIPFILHIMCCVYADIKDVEAPKTMTQIYVMSCIVFSRAHLRDGAKHERFGPLETEIVNLLLEVAEMAWVMLVDGKVVFLCKEGIDIDKFQRSGLLILYPVKDQKFAMFRHTFLQEFFAALHIFFRKLPFVEYGNNRYLNGVLQILSGLQGACLETSNAPRYLKDFVASFEAKTYWQSNQDLIQNLMLQLPRHQDTDSVIFSNWIRGDRSKGLNSMNFIKVMYENQNELGPEFKELPSVSFDFWQCNRHEAMQVFHMIRMCSNNKIPLEKMDLKSDSTKELIQEACAWAPQFRLLQLDSVTLNPSLVSNLVDRLMINKDQSQMKLESIWLLDCNLNEHLVKLLSPLIPMLKLVDLRLNKLSLRSCREIAMQMQNKNVSLQDFSLPECSLNGKMVKELSSFLPRIKKVDLSQNQIGTLGCEALADVITKYSTVDTVNLCHLSLIQCHLNNKAVAELSRVVPLIQRVDLSWNRLTIDGCKALANAVKTAAKVELKHISFRNCSLDDEMVAELALAIPYIKTVDVLDNKNITPKGCHFVTDAILNCAYDIILRSLTVDAVSVGIYQEALHERGYVAEVQGRTVYLDAFVKMKPFGGHSEIPV